MLTRIGITGGIGSGKSEVCKIISSFGVPVISADLIARRLTDSNPEIKKKVIARFGLDSYAAATGTLNRAYVASLVFGNKENLLALNAIVHPPVLKSVDDETQAIEKIHKAGYIIVEAALMFESGLNKKLDYVLTVAAEDALRIDRVRNRSNLTEEQIRSRMESQIPIDEAIELSDFVLHNNGSVEDLQQKVIFFHTLFSALKPQAKRDHGHSR
jgi:dephospho-CoA kinase